MTNTVANPPTPATEASASSQNMRGDLLPDANANCNLLNMFAAGKEYHNQNSPKLYKRQVRLNATAYRLQLVLLALTCYPTRR